MDKILVVEDEVITSDLLRRYFEIVGYEVLNAQTGKDALKLAVAEKPRVIILDIMLPDMDGYDVCRKLRADDKTSNIPIIFLTQKDDRRDRLEGLELGADDYLTKPFDVEELRLRVHNIIGRSGGTPLVDPRTSLPNIDLIRDRLPKLLEASDSIFIDAEIQHFTPFGKQYGPVAANQVVRSTAKIVGDLLHEIDPMKTFIGHPNDDHFLLAVPRDSVDRVEEELPRRFAKHVAKFYDIPEQERGYMKTKDGENVPFMAFNLTRIKAQKLKDLIDKAQHAQTPTMSVSVSSASDDKIKHSTEKAETEKPQTGKAKTISPEAATQPETTPAKKPEAGKSESAGETDKGKPSLTALPPTRSAGGAEEADKEKPHPAKPDLKIVVDNTQKDTSRSSNGKAGKDDKDASDS